MPKILAFSGSLRKDSLNKKLLKVACDAATTSGADITVIDLLHYDFPIYNPDIVAQKGIPDNVLALKEIFKKHVGFLIAMPEYSGSITPALKNTIDWISHDSDPADRKLVAFWGKMAGIMSVSNRVSWGLRGLIQLRMLLQNVGINVLAHQCCIGGNAQTFDTEVMGHAPTKKRVEVLGIQLTEFLARLADPPFPFF